jgi:hypothetical protein
MKPLSGFKDVSGTLWAGTAANEKAQTSATAPVKLANRLTIRLFSCRDFYRTAVSTAYRVNASAGSEFRRDATVLPRERLVDPEGRDFAVHRD